MMQWPIQQWHSDTDLLHAGDRDEGGGMAMRLLIIAARSQAFANPMQRDFAIEFTPAQLWCLDTVFWNSDYRTAKMDAGTPVIRLAEKVWDALLEYHQPDLPTEFQSHDPAKVIPIDATQREKLRLLDEKMGWAS